MWSWWIFDYDIYLHPTFHIASSKNTSYFRYNKWIYYIFNILVHTINRCTRLCGCRPKSAHIRLGSPADELSRMNSYVSRHVSFPGERFPADSTLEWLFYGARFLAFSGRAGFGRICRTFSTWKSHVVVHVHSSHVFQQIAENRKSFMTIFTLLHHRACAVQCRASFELKLFPRANFAGERLFSRVRIAFVAAVDSLFLEKKTLVNKRCTRRRRIYCIFGSSIYDDCYQ